MLCIRLLTREQSDFMGSGQYRTGKGAALRKEIYSSIFLNSSRVNNRARARTLVTRRAVPHPNQYSQHNHRHCRPSSPRHILQRERNIQARCHPGSPSVWSGKVLLRTAVAIISRTMYLACRTKLKVGLRRGAGSDTLSWKCAA
jgi:hypothetical protein